MNVIIPLMLIKKKKKIIPLISRWCPLGLGWTHGPFTFFGILVFIYLNSQLLGGRHAAWTITLLETFFFSFFWFIIISYESRACNSLWKEPKKILKKKKLVTQLIDTFPTETSKLQSLNSLIPNYWWIKKILLICIFFFLLY